MNLATLFAPVNYLISSAYYWSGALVGLTQGVWVQAVSIVRPAVDHGKSRSAAAVENTKIKIFETHEVAKARAVELTPEAVAKPLGLNKTSGAPLTTPDGPQINGSETGFQPMSPPVVEKPVLRVSAAPITGKTASPAPLDPVDRTAVPSPTNGLAHNVAVMDAAIVKPAGTVEGHALDHADDTSDDVSEDLDDPTRKSLDGAHGNHKTRNAIKRTLKKIGSKVTPHSPSHASHAQAV